MGACEKAMVLDPENPDFHDSRGLARALSGNVSGAVDDFQFFMLNTNNPTRKAELQSWVKALAQIKNP
jgi:hypothetical protein